MFFFFFISLARDVGVSRASQVSTCAADDDGCGGAEVNEFFSDFDWILTRFSCIFLAAPADDRAPKTIKGMCVCLFVFIVKKFLFVVSSS